MTHPTMHACMTTSIAIALFGGGGLLLGLIGTGLFYEACIDAGVVDQFKFTIEPTIFNSLILGSPFIIALSALLFFSVYESLRISTRADWGDYLFPSLTFLAVFAVWMVKDFVILKEFGWTGFLHASLIGGISAFSHGTSLDSIKVHQSVDELLSLPGKRKKDIDVILKRLELEHNAIQTTLQWFVTGGIIFLTAAVAGYYFNPIGYSPGDPIIGTRLTTVFMGGLWGVMGLIIGIIMPNLKKMQYIREQMRTLLLKPQQNQKTAKPKKDGEEDE